MKLFRFSLRQMLVATALVAAGLGAWQWYYRGNCELVYYDGIPRLDKRGKSSLMSGYRTGWYETSYHEQTAGRFGDEIRYYRCHNGHDFIHGYFDGAEDPPKSEITTIHQAFRAPSGSYVVWRLREFDSGGMWNDWALWSSDTWNRITKNGTWFGAPMK